MERVLKGRTAGYELCGNVLVIVPFKELDHCCAVDVREEADSLIEKSGALHLLFDFSEISFMDSSGIGVVMGRYSYPAVRPFNTRSITIPLSTENNMFDYVE